MSEAVATLLIAGAGGIANLVWMLTTLRIESRIGLKIDDLKAWMEGRYVSVPTFTGFQQIVAVQHAELERRVVKLELRP